MSYEDFEREAELYSDSKRDFERNHLLKMNKVIETMRVGTGQKILEVGLGTGYHGKVLKDRLDVGYFGVEISEKLIMKARNIVSGSLVRADGMHLPFKNKSFDHIFCVSVIYLMDDIGKAIDEFVRVVKPGGKLILLEPNHLSVWDYLFGRRKLAVYQKTKRYGLGKRELRMLLEQAGLKEIEVMNFLYTPSYPGFLYRFYDFLNKLLPEVCILKNFSVMNLGVGVK